ncbi:Protein lin-32 [Trichinella pseudospiralis]|uniref:Protein lin-32 n=1 Tax=Trichinella pseudospiralis TaxID=6337 RepID=A0A0V1E5S3_TRIPS|nr:Protein lin-32 [Trichinella pseudospiralis]
MYKSRKACGKVELCNLESIFYSLEKQATMSSDRFWHLKHEKVSRNSSGRLVDRGIFSRLLRIVLLRKQLVTGRKRPQNAALLTSVRGRSSTSTSGSYDCAQMKTYVHIQQRICGARGRLRRQTELSNCHAWIVIMPVCQSTLIGQNWLYSLEKHQCGCNHSLMLFLLLCIRVAFWCLLEMDTTNSYSQMVSCGQEPFTNRQQFTYRTASNRWMPYAVPTDRLHGYVDDAANLSYQTLYGYESPGDYNNRDFVNPTSVYHQQQQQQQQLQQQQQSVMFQQNEAYSTKSTACTSWLNNNTTAVENANSQNNASSSSRNNSGNSSSSSSSSNNNSNKRALSHMHTMAGQPEMRRRRLAANERERRRMNSLNGAFDNLRNVLPSIESGKNLSKIETLLMAQEYIRVLQELIGSNK